jgi:transposase
LTDYQWSLVEPLFDPPGRRGRPAAISRRQMVNAILYLARTGAPWRYLPREFGEWGAVWQQFRRWRDSGVWARAMTLLRRLVRFRRGRSPEPSMVMVDAQTVRGGRAGPSFHEAGGRGGRTIGAKRSVLVDITGSPVAVDVRSAKPHDLRAARELLTRELPTLGRLEAVVADRGYRGLARQLERQGIKLDIKQPPKGASRFVPIRPLVKVEHCFAQLGRYRRLARSYEGSQPSALAWVEVACVGSLLARLNGRSLPASWR